MKCKDCLVEVGEANQNSLCPECQAVRDDISEAQMRFEDFFGICETCHRKFPTDILNDDCECPDCAETRLDQEDGIDGDWFYRNEW